MTCGQSSSFSFMTRIHFLFLVYPRLTIVLIVVICSRLLPCFTYNKRTSDSSPKGITNHFSRLTDNHLPIFFFLALIVVHSSTANVMSESTWVGSVRVRNRGNNVRHRNGGMCTKILGSYLTLVYPLGRSATCSFQAVFTPSFQMPISVSS